MGTLYAGLSDWAAYADPNAAPASLPVGVEPPLSSAITDAQKTRYLQACSDKASSQISKRYALPITGWGEDLIEAVCAMAYAMALDVQGYDPKGGQDKRIQDRAADRWKWLQDIGRGDANLVGAVDQTPDVEDFVGTVIGPRRTGWIYRPLYASDGNFYPLGFPLPDGVFWL